MRFPLAVTLALLAVSGSSARGAEETSKAAAAEALVGAWRLASIETIGPKGQVTHPFYGKRPEGLLIYDRSGWMSVQIVSDPKPAVPTAASREKFLAAPAAEKAAAIDGYYAYFGTWTLDAEGKTVTHHIDQSLYPAERATEGARQVTLAGDTLTLVARTHELGEDHERRLVWKRVAPAR